ncbi:unnamed protein product [Timema podura]|uniref:Charged multivesicular body protein 7 n=1 Tax=Timema podura TaxID=61482 RepID=A0ABN7NXE7_TIMPD|nr:unnamed protein product [Timema podura]
MFVDDELTMWGVFSGELTEYSEFVKVPPQQSWASWTLSLLVKSPLLWSMQKMKDALISPTFAMESKYVHLGAAKSIAGESPQSPTGMCPSGWNWLGRSQVQKVVMESMVGLGLDWARGTWFRDSFPGLVELGAPGADLLRGKEGVFPGSVVDGRRGLVWSRLEMGLRGCLATYGEELTKQLNDHQTIKLVDLQNIFDIVKEKKWRNEDVLVAIHWLRHQGVVSVLEQPDLLENPLLIKVNKKGQTGISELDMAVYSLWSNETTLLKHIEQLETERTAALNEARGYLIKGTRNMAKTSLRKKHELERIIEKKVLTLENVRILLNQLNDSDLDAQVLESYKKGTSVLKAVLKDARLTEESVSSTMLQLEEANMKKRRLEKPEIEIMTSRQRSISYIENPGSVTSSVEGGRQVFNLFSDEASLYP